MKSKKSFCLTGIEIRGPDSSLQFDRIMKSSRPSTTVPKLLKGTPYFKKGPYDEPSIDIGRRSNCSKANFPTITTFCCVNLRKTQKDLDKDVLNYVDMKILAQVNCIRNSSEDEIRQAKNKDPNSDFLHFTFPIHEDMKLKAIDKHICTITVLGDPGTCSSNPDKRKPLCFGQKRKKIPLEKNFDPSDLVSSNPDKKLFARNAVRAIAHMM